MSKKNSIVLNLKNSLSSSEPISNIFLNFKSKISKLKTNKFLVAVSGGPDSLALVALCRDYELNNKKIKFHYVLINHGIRKNSSEEAKQVKKILKKQNITLKVITNKKKIVNNIQHNARKTRYSLLSAECKKKKIRTILTGHHKDDQIETFLIRLSRGSGIQGLSSMSTITALDNKIKLFRPLLSEEKKNLIVITKKVFGNFIKDPSNNNKKFLRSSMRKLLPILKRHGISDNQIIKSINNLKSSNKTINIYFGEVFKKIVKKRHKKIFIKKNDLFSLNDEIQIKILGKIIKSIKKTEYPPRAKKLQTALKFLNTRRDSKRQLGGCSLISKNNHIIIHKSL